MNQDLTIVPNYGVHIAPGGVAFLEQGKGGTNVIGLREKSPFRVRLPGRPRPCNHIIATATQNPATHHMEVFDRIFGDGLVQAMLPIPRKGPKAFYVADPDNGLDMHLVILSRLSSPIYPIIANVTMTTKQTIREELTTTNVQPYVLTGWQTGQSPVIEELGPITLSQPRTLVCTGHPSVVLPQQFKRITTKLVDFPIRDLMALPMESIGATLLRFYMRKTWAWGAPLPNPEKDAHERRDTRKVEHFIRHPKASS